MGHGEYCGTMDGRLCRWVERGRIRRKRDAELAAIRTGASGEHHGQQDNDNALTHLNLDIITAD